MSLEGTLSFQQVYLRGGAGVGVGDGVVRAETRWSQQLYHEGIGLRDDSSCLIGGGVLWVRTG